MAELYPTTRLDAFDKIIANGRSYLDKPFPSPSVDGLLDFDGRLVYPHPLGTRTQVFHRGKVKKVYEKRDESFDCENPDDNPLEVLKLFFDTNHRVGLPLVFGLPEYRLKHDVIGKSVVAYIDYDHMTNSRLGFREAHLWTPDKEWHLGYTQELIR